MLCRLRHYARLMFVSPRSHNITAISRTPHSSFSGCFFLRQTTHFRLGNLIFFPCPMSLRRWSQQSMSGTSRDLCETNGSTGRLTHHRLAHSVLPTAQFWLLSMFMENGYGTGRANPHWVWTQTRYAGAECTSLNNLNSQLVRCQEKSRFPKYY